MQLRWRLTWAWCTSYARSWRRRTGKSSTKAPSSCCHLKRKSKGTRTSLTRPSACPPGLKRPNGRSKSTKRNGASWRSRALSRELLPRGTALSRELFEEVPRSWSASFNLGTTGSNFWIWNDRIKYFQFWNNRIRFNFNLGTTGSNFLNLERQDQIFSILERQDQI